MSDERIRREMEAADQIRASMETRIGYMVRSVMDDIRHNVVEQPWFGRNTTDNLTDVMYRMEVLDKGQEEKDNAIEALYGKDESLEAETADPEREINQKEMDPGIDDREMEMGE